MHQRPARDTNFHHLSQMEQCVAWLSRGPERTVDRPLVTLGQYFWEALSEAFSRQQRVTIPAPREHEPLQAPPTPAAGPEGTGAPPVSLPLEPSAKVSSRPRPRPPQAAWKSWAEETALDWFLTRAKAAQTRRRTARQWHKLTWQRLSAVRGDTHQIVSAKTLARMARHHHITLQDLESSLETLGTIP
jgi:hypothetical protein